MTRADLDEICQQIYDETKLQPWAVAYKDLGFKILYGPPLANPPILFIGYQPGGNEKDKLQEDNKYPNGYWAETCEYATENWRLAKKMQEMFGEELLKKCVGTNAIFQRSKTDNDYIKRIPRAMRKQIESFSVHKVREIIQYLNPQLIVAIGFKTAKLLGVEVKDTRLHGRKILKEGYLYNRKFIASIHLTGAYISTEDRNFIKEYILSEVRSF